MCLPDTKTGENPLPRCSDMCCGFLLMLLREFMITREPCSYSTDLSTQG